MNCVYHLRRALLIIRTAILLQRVMYGNAPPAAALIDEDDIEQALALNEE